MSYFQLLKSTDPQTYFIIVGVIILVVLTFVSSIYAAIRVDRIYKQIERRREIEQIKNTVKQELQTAK